jgi:hypothetical protein
MEKNRLERACEDYDSDKDYNGARGIALAELKLRNNSKSRQHPSVIKKPINEIIKLPPKIVGIRLDANILIKKDLENLSNEGYKIDKGYKKMDSTQLWNYYLKTLRENGYYSTP